jgi:hypothetical protein
MPTTRIEEALLSRVPAHAPRLPLLVLLCGLLHVLACGSAALPGNQGEGTSEYGDDSGLPASSDGDQPVANVLLPAPTPERHASAQKFVELCSACHGDWAEGSSAPSLWDIGLTRDALVQKIALTMPPKDPSLCTDKCAEDMADYLLGEFAASARTCAGIRPSPRQLRLLNRREYANTVRSLFGSQLGTGEGVSESCGAHLFSFDPGAPVASVHVAGTFNGWSDSAWPMTYSAGDGRWLLERELAEGTHEFKYVVRSEGSGEPTWLSDPLLPQTGAYGNSSVTVQACTDTEERSAVDFSGLPAETRPVAFPFDTTVSSVIGTQQFEAYFDTAKKIAFAVDAPTALLGCDLAQDGEGCARAFLTSFGKRVFRRPLTDAELARYGALLVAQPDPEVAARTALTALLVSPHFLYRSELGTQQPDGTYLLTPHELASALSYTFVADMPDDALFAAAESGALASSDEIRAQAERLLKAPASRTAVTDFVLEWLGVDGVSALAREASEHPDFTTSLSESMATETRMLAEHVLFASTGTVGELLSADYTFANAQLASLYGMGGEFADGYRQVGYADDARAGVLGHASVLATYAHANQTSPVLRGLFVRRQLMCQRFGEPPPNAGTVPELDPSLSTRQRFDMHSTESCASCHVHIDALGFGFEHFDTLGRYREREGEHLVDARGEITGLTNLRDGSAAAFATPRMLAPLLVESEATHSCVSKQSYRFIRGALDSGLQYCALKFVRGRYRASKGKILEALLASVESVDFRYRY